MSRKSRQAALRILLLLEEFSPQELADALNLIGGMKDEDLPAFLTRMTSERNANSRAAPQREAIRPGESRALQGLKEVDPDKYEVLRQFETAIREGRLFATLDELRTVGRMWRKDYSPGKSRKEAITRLMELLVNAPLCQIRDFIARAPTKSTEDSTAFVRLANQIIAAGRLETTNTMAP